MPPPAVEANAFSSASVTGKAGRTVGGVAVGRVTASAGVAVAAGGRGGAVAFAMTGEGEGKTGGGVGVDFLAKTIAVADGEVAAAAVTGGRWIAGDAFAPAVVFVFFATSFPEGAGDSIFGGGVAAATFAPSGGNAVSTRMSSFAEVFAVVVTPAIGIVPSAARPALAK